MHRGLVSKGVFVLTPNGESTEELVQAGSYGWRDKRITSANFPLKAQGAQSRIIELMSVERGFVRKLFGRADVFPINLALRRAVRRRLQRPTYNDALLFGVQYPEAHRKWSIIFPHEPWIDPRGKPVVIKLGHGSVLRYLELEDIDSLHRWGSVLAFVWQ